MKVLPIPRAPPNESDDRLLRIEEVGQLTTLSKSAIRLWVAQGRFPEPAALSPTIKVWRLSQIQSWIDSLFTGANENSPTENLD
jgi:predicted DNA-binding transcriptional regulator AlpA